MTKIYTAIGINREHKRHTGFYLFGVFTSIQSLKNAILQHAKQHEDCIWGTYDNIEITISTLNTQITTYQKCNISIKDFNHENMDLGEWEKTVSDAIDTLKPTDNTESDKIPIEFHLFDKHDKQIDWKELPVHEALDLLKVWIDCMQEGMTDEQKNRMKYGDLKLVNTS